MEVFKEYLAKLNDASKYNKMNELLNWTQNEFNLIPRLAWNQPMFTNKETFIIAYSYSKNHISVAPEAPALEKFKPEIAQLNYSLTSKMFRIPWDEEIDFSLLKKIIQFNIIDKDGYDKFWR